MSAWRNWLRSPVLLKYFVGQHIVNGVSVAAAVMLVSVAASSILGFGLGQPATLGAIGASISDFPGPWRVKARTLLVGFSLSLVSTIAVEFGQVNPLTPEQAQQMLSRERKVWTETVARTGAQAR